MEAMEIDEANTTQSNLATVLSSLLPYIHPSDWFSLRLVCKGWNHAVRGVMCNTKSLKIQDFIGIPRSSPKRESMDCYGWIAYHADGLKCFIEKVIKRHGKRLESLVFFDYGYGFSEKGFGPPIRLKNTDIHALGEITTRLCLTTLDFTGVEVPWHPLFRRVLPKCIYLETLILRGTIRKLNPPNGFDESVMFDAFSKMVNLKYLDLSGTKWFSGKALRAMPTSMETLILDGCSLNGKMVAAHIGRLIELHCLVFDSGLHTSASYPIVSMPRLEKLIMDGEDKSSPRGTQDIIRQWTSPQFAGCKLTTICLGERVMELKSNEVKEFFRRSWTKEKLEVLEIHSKNLSVNDDPALIAECFEAIGNLSNLHHLEISFDVRLPLHTATILTRIFDGCTALEKLALRFDFVFPCNDDAYLEALKKIGTLFLNDLSFITPNPGCVNGLAGPISTIDRCLDTICYQLSGRLKKLRFGCIREWPTPENSPHLTLSTDLTELELVFNERVQAPDPEDLMDLLNVFSGSLKKVRLVNVGAREKKFRNMMKKVGKTGRYSKIELTSMAKCNDEYCPMLAGGSVAGIRKNLSYSTSFAKTC